jgi:hypothetical protein
MADQSLGTYNLFEFVDRGIGLLPITAGITAVPWSRPSSLASEPAFAGCRSVIS